ncbi:hypothetical protein K439DRAFT_753118 [Ramaria rubella]|nr:hypothetical protein K439DRAFT_753118 [Ramaria rubella]
MFGICGDQATIEPRVDMLEDLNEEIQQSAIEVIIKLMEYEEWHACILQVGFTASLSEKIQSKSWIIRHLAVECYSAPETCESLQSDF